MHRKVAMKINVKNVSNITYCLECWFILMHRKYKHSKILIIYLFT